MGERIYELNPQEELALTAQAAAYRAFAHHEVQLFAGRPGVEDLPARQQVLKAIGSLYAVRLPDTDRAAFIAQVAEHLGASLKNFFDPQKSALNYFLTTYKNEALKFSSIGTEVESWLAKFNKVAAGYFGPATIEREFPKLRLLFEIDERLKLGVSGRTELNTEDIKSADRNIVIRFNPAQFNAESYFAIPYVLSHEYWCHGLSRWRHGSEGRMVDWTGCSPLDSWEEGWMDFVQFQLLQRVLENSDNDAAMDGQVFKHCSAAAVARYAGDEKVLRGKGYQGAWALLRFLKTRVAQLMMRLNSMPPDELFLALALDLNALYIDARIKRNFVLWIAGYLSQAPVTLGPPTSLSDQDQRLVAGRLRLTEIFVRNLQESAPGTKLNVVKLLSLCRQQD
ncbi:MAG TPA: hypothetical protein VKH81_23055 [Candidatus Angelobacter sp.]|nr:hypothetical protein [Candidatus Angelobacter sp.]